ncbi:hypothetical protein [Streptomyces sp. NPDC049881]|uniref:hypothetical protein n=1 Tax=Streptomyces sp. NPDC049881 TaxID=3155778 RepID=UPI00341F6498
MPHAARLFTGGETGEAQGWARDVLAAWGWGDAAPVVGALVTVAQGRRPWWLSLRDHGEAVHAQVLRARAARIPELPQRIAGADGLAWTYGAARTPDGLCLWVSVSVSAPG